jgi:hypothetical protein
MMGPSCVANLAICLRKLSVTNRNFPIDEHGEPIRVHSPFEPDTLSFRLLCELFAECQTHPLSPAKYFAFERFAQLAGE